MTTERLFFALWPDEPTRAHLAAAADRAIQPGTGRRVAAENLHLTLCFLGSVDAARRICIEHAAENVRGTPVELTIEQVEWRRRIGIVWAGPMTPPAALQSLVHSLETALRVCEFTPEVRPYRAHVTLARNVRHGKGFVLNTPIRWVAHQFCLVVSHTRPEGSRYEVARCWDLSG